MTRDEEIGRLKAVYAVLHKHEQVLPLEQVQMLDTRPHEDGRSSSEPPPRVRLERMIESLGAGAPRSDAGQLVRCGKSLRLVAEPDIPVGH
jgi:hypothetical protein